MISVAYGSSQSSNESNEDSCTAFWGRLSTRGYHRTLRVARTLADLDGEEKVARIHIAEALSYRGETLRRAQAAA